jgi:hypothetical protein
MVNGLTLILCCARDAGNQSLTKDAGIGFAKRLLPALDLKDGRLSRKGRSAPSLCLL